MSKSNSPRVGRPLPTIVKTNNRNVSDYHHLAFSRDRLSQLCERRVFAILSEKAHIINDKDVVLAGVRCDRSNLTQYRIRFPADGVVLDMRIQPKQRGSIQ